MSRVVAGDYRHQDVMSWKSGIVICLPMLKTLPINPSTVSSYKILARGKALVFVEFLDGKHSILSVSDSQCQTIITSLANVKQVDSNYVANLFPSFVTPEVEPAPAPETISSPQATTDIEVNNPDYMDNPVDVGRHFSANFELYGGLNIPAGTKCKVEVNGPELSIRAHNQEYIIPNKKIVNVSVQTSKEIQKQYVSSVGGAIAGGLFFGPLGAAFGGAAKIKKIKTDTTFLMLAYEKAPTDVQYIVFKLGTWDKGHANQLASIYRKFTKEKTIQL